MMKDNYDFNLKAISDLKTDFKADENSVKIAGRICFTFCFFGLTSIISATVKAISKA
ncbi:hypothetical protein [Virgibacillus halodenitrificans]|uniref:hypothetical protein n=1 Tax=Virgibacillus halodenitrificans TaxID=1482 RepID=UPI002DB89751|nr:hypothetical protein [Virgibacillus halodenitrificans]MEC2159750.1 hypothetical protein [Virgibacillus halodenitrificans]